MAWYTHTALLMMLDSGCFCTQFSSFQDKLHSVVAHTNKKYAQSKLRKEDKLPVLSGAKVLCFYMLE